MTRDPLAELERAVALLEKRAKKKQAPSHADARELLGTLGELILLDRGEAAGPLTARLKAATLPVHEKWLAAVAREMEIACLEHVQGVDPRFLDHPRYDFEYTVRARERLEMRLVAADALGIEVDEGLLARVAAADETLAPYLRPRDGEGV